MSLASGQIIDKINICAKYFPLPFDRYICFGPFSKDSKNYDLWNDVLSILIPILNSANIKIVQLGAANERQFKGTYYLAGQTSINQCAFLIQHSLLFLGADSYGQHLAGSYDIPLVDLISNNFADCVRPYFGTRERQIIIEPPRDVGEKPSFALQELPKTINKIHPEEIAQSVCKLLNLKYDFPFKQLYLGEVYISPMIESACDSVFEPKQFGVDSIIMRMDYNFNPEILTKQLQISACSIITDKPIDNNILNGFKGTGRIKEIIYVIKEVNNPDFVKDVIRAGIQIRLISRLNQEEINQIKLNYMDYGPIIKKFSINPNNIENIKNEDKSSLFFKSAKFTIGKGKVFPSKANYLLDRPINSFDDISPVIDNSDFWEDIESFRIFKNES